MNRVIDTLFKSTQSRLCCVRPTHSRFQNNVLNKYNNNILNSNIFKHHNNSNINIISGGFKRTFFSSSSLSFFSNNSTINNDNNNRLVNETEIEKYQSVYSNILSGDIDPNKIPLAFDAAEKVLAIQPTNMEAISVKSILLFFSERLEECLELCKLTLKTLEDQRSKKAIAVDLEFYQYRHHFLNLSGASLYRSDKFQEASVYYTQLLNECSQLEHSQQEHLVPLIDASQLKIIHNTFIQCSDERMAFEALSKLERDHPEELDLVEYLLLGKATYEKFGNKPAALSYLNKSFDMIDFSELLEKYKPYQHLDIYTQEQENTIQRINYDIIDPIHIQDLLFLRYHLLSDSNKSDQLVENQILIMEIDASPDRKLMYHSVLAKLQNSIHNYKESYEHIKILLNSLKSENNSFDELFTSQIPLMGMIDIIFMKMKRNEADPFVDEWLSFLVNNINSNDGETGRIFVKMAIRYYCEVLVNPSKSEWNQFINNLPESERNITSEHLTLQSFDDIQVFANRWLKALEYSPKPQSPQDGGSSGYFDDLEKLLKTLDITSKLGQRLNTLAGDSSEKKSVVMKFASDLVFLIKNQFSECFGVKSLVLFNKYNIHMSDIEWTPSRMITSPCNADEMVYFLLENDMMVNDVEEKGIDTQKTKDTAQTLIKSSQSFGYALLAFARSLSSDMSELVNINQLFEYGLKLNHFNNELESQLFTTVQGLIQFHHQDSKKGIETLLSLVNKSNKDQQQNPPSLLSKVLLAKCYLQSYQFQDADNLLNEVISRCIVANHSSVTKRIATSASTLLGISKYHQNQYSYAIELFKSYDFNNSDNSNNNDKLYKIIKTVVYESKLQIMLSSIEHCRTLVSSPNKDNNNNKTQQTKAIASYLDLVSGIINFILDKQLQSLSDFKKLDHIKSIEEITLHLPELECAATNYIWYFYASIIPRLDQGSNRFGLPTESALILIPEILQKLNFYIKN